MVECSKKELFYISDRMWSRSYSYNKSLDYSNIKRLSNQHKFKRYYNEIKDYNVSRILSLIKGYNL